MKAPLEVVVSAVNHGCGESPEFAVLPSGYLCRRCQRKVLLNPRFAPTPLVPPLYL